MRPISSASFVLATAWILSVPAAWAGPGAKALFRGGNSLYEK